MKFSGVALLAAEAWAISRFAGAESTLEAEASPPSLRYSVVPGFFKQSMGETDEKTFDSFGNSFGLNYTGPDRWSHFQRAVSSLNEQAPEDVSYRVLYLARHGQGHHNAAEQFFGPEAWECYWAMQGTNGTYTWGPDAKLTEKGITEAERTAAAWKSQHQDGIPLPQVHYVSPLSRSLQTMVITWEDIALDPPKPTVIEELRETLGLHYGDKRMPTEHLLATYPLEKPLGFAATDPMWSFLRESERGRNARIKLALDGIFSVEPRNNTYISMTSHSGVINSTLVALGHRPYNLPTAGMIPVVVKIEQGGDEREESRFMKGWRPEVEERSVCEGYPAVKVAGRYVDGMGVWPDS
ncbi:putative phosphoglycerate mutase pmu1 [Rhizina undulata]